MNDNHNLVRLISKNLSWGFFKNFLYTPPDSEHPSIYSIYEKLLSDARAVEAAGAFALVLECMPAEVGRRISEALTIPTIGIGSGIHCDGQVQVLYDVLGLFEEFTPKHSRRYAELGRLTREALKNYADDVRNGAFPGPENSF